MKRIHIFLMVLVLLIAACNQNEKKSPETITKEKTTKTPTVHEDRKTAAVEDQYKVKEGLDTDSKPEDPKLDTEVDQSKEEEDANKKLDIVAYKNAPANVTFTDTRLGEVFKYYIEMKTAMVNGDVKKVAEATINLMMGYANFGVDEEVLYRANDIVIAKDIEAQRQQLPGVTEDVAAMLKGNIKSGKIYRIYCPMAFNTSGAQWLAFDKTIENPYFGESMLNCGTVQEALE